MNIQKNLNVNDYESLKAEYISSKLWGYEWHKRRLKYWKDKLEDLDTWAAQGFSHGKDYKEEHVPQKHYRGDFTEQKILDYGEQLEAIEQKIAEEQAELDEIDNWINGLQSEERWLITDRFFKKKPYNIMAQLYGCSKNTMITMIDKILIKYPEELL